MQQVGLLGDFPKEGAALFAEKTKHAMVRGIS